MIPIIYPYKMHSGSAKRLADALNTRRVRPNGLYQPRSKHLIVNWGNSSIPTWAMNAAQLLNPPYEVRLACNKLYALNDLDFHNVPIPAFTCDPAVARGWLQDGDSVVSRYLLNSHSGKGIVIDSLDSYDIFIHRERAPLYVKYFKKKHEYRVHVFNGKVIDVQQKRKRRETDVNYQIRNHANGWVYCREDVSPPPEALDIAVKAVAALGLDFGAVDVAYNQHYDKCVVFEVNTAPGSFGHTHDVYVNAIKEML